MSIDSSDKDRRFWAKRAKKYNNLEWANKGDYLHKFLNAGRFHEEDVVLDVGSGTGIIAHTLSPFVRKVVGIDISEDMLRLAKDPMFKNIEWLRMDAHDIKFKKETFHKVTARMVFHHILEYTEKAMRECHRVLRKGGLMVLSEGVPPSEHVKSFYTEMFKLKENRLTFMEEDLLGLMKKAGFRRIKKIIFYARQSSIRNWLSNSSLPRATQETIFKMHLSLDERGKKDYQMTLRGNDCFIDMKFVILTAEK